MSDQQQKTAQRPVREQLRAAEDTTQSVLYAWSGMMATMTGQTTELVERNLRLTDELAHQVNHTFQEGMDIWLRLAHDSLNSWRNYLQAITNIAVQSTRDVADSATRSVGQH